LIEKKSAGAVIFNETLGERYYLLLHYDAGHWDFPKGGIEEGESELDAVIREVREETGIADLKLIGGFRQTISYQFKSTEGEINKTVVFYLGSTSTFKVTLSHEHRAYAWLKFEDALEHLTFDTARSVLKVAHKFLENLSRSKAQEGQKSSITRW
jgi:8-oxo-dGTP pyrophosphatase MutT (NUDIX family)